MTVTIAIEPVRQPEILALIALSDDYMNSLYPPEGNFAVNVDELEKPYIRFAVARLDGAAEIKRLFVHETGRGHGLGKKLMAFLETPALDQGIHTINLETGPLNIEAVKLYETLGYTVCGPFGTYPDNPYSLFMTKTLAFPAPVALRGSHA